MDQTLEIGFVLDTVKRAFTIAIPEIINSDQGSHFTSPKYINLLKEHPSIQISMDCKGRALDKIMIERFCRSLKYEEVYLKDYGTPREARLNVRDYMKLYNEDRPHQALDYKTPAAVYYG